MDLGPVLLREMRAACRQKPTYWMRVMAAAGALLVFALAMIGRPRGPAQLGAEIFGNLNALVCAFMALAVPILTADCISREKREGTLGLLFLTQLSATEIVAAKSFIHALRAFMLWAAIMPVMFIPILMGGVSGQHILLAATGTCSLFLISLSAGLIASAQSVRWARALTLALILNGVGIAFFGCVWFAGFVEYVLKVHVPIFSQEVIPWLAYFFIGPIFLSDVEGVAYQFLSQAKPGGFAAWLSLNLAALFFSGVIFLLAFRFAAASLRRHWREDPPSARQIWWWQTFCTPVLYKQFFRRKMTRTLEKNPITWLWSHSWSARLIRLGWTFGVLMAHGAVIAAGAYDDMADLQIILVLMLLAGMAFSAAGSFLHERETGVLELLLVTAIRSRTVIWGRLLAIYHQFLPAIGLIIFFWAVFKTPLFGLHNWDFSNWVEKPDFWLLFWLHVASLFLVVPMIGLAFSVEGVPLFVAWPAAWVAGVLLPQFVAATFSFCGYLWLNWTMTDWEWTLEGQAGFWPAILARFGLGLLAWFHACRGIDQRRFIKGWRQDWLRRKLAAILQPMGRSGTSDVT